MSSSNCCFLTCIQISQEAGQVVWYSHLFQSCPTLCHTIDCNPWNSPGQNTGVVRLFLLRGIFPIQESNPGLLHFRQILYQLSHRWSPRILVWVAYPFSSRSTQPRNRTRVSCITGGLFTNWAIREHFLKINRILFDIPVHFIHEISEFKNDKVNKWILKPWSTHEGPSWWQTHLCFPFLVCRKRLCLLGLPWVPKSKLRQLLIKELRKYRKKTNKNSQQEK